jgi:hypothetical protein
MQRLYPQKYIVFDLMEVLLVKDPTGDIVINNYFVSRIHTIISHGLKIVVLFQSDEKHLIERISNLIPQKSALIFEVPNNKKSGYDLLLQSNELNASDCFYAFSDNDIGAALYEIEGFCGCRYSVRSKINYSFETRMAAKGFFWPNSRNPNVKMDSRQLNLATTLVRYIMLCISRQFTAKRMWEYLELGNYYTDTPIYYQKQHNGEAGALLSTEGIKAFERGCGVLFMWGVVTDLHNGNLFRSDISASEIHDLKNKEINFNMELFAYTLEAFFDCHNQSPFGSVGYEKDSPFYVAVDGTILELFKENSLVENSKTGLSWSEKMEPYFLCCTPPIYAFPDENEKFRDATAQEFFDEICS